MNLGWTKQQITNVIDSDRQKHRITRFNLWQAHRNRG